MIWNKGRILTTTFDPYANVPEKVDSLYVC